MQEYFNRELTDEEIRNISELPGLVLLCIAKTTNFLTKKECDVYSNALFSSNDTPNGFIAALKKDYAVHMINSFTIYTKSQLPPSVLIEMIQGRVNSINESLNTNAVDEMRIFSLGVGEDVVRKTSFFSRSKKVRREMLKEVTKILTA